MHRSGPEKYKIFAVVVLSLIKVGLIFQGPRVMVDAVAPPFPRQHLFSHSFLSILLHSLFPITTTLPEALVISFVDGHRSRLDDYSLSCFFRISDSATHTFQSLLEHTDQNVYIAVQEMSLLGSPLAA